MIAERKRKKKEDTPKYLREPSFPFTLPLRTRTLAMVGHSLGEVVGNRGAHQKGTNRDLRVYVYARVQMCMARVLAEREFLI